MFSVMLILTFAVATWKAFAGDSGDKERPHPRAVLWSTHQIVLDVLARTQAERDAYLAELTATSKATADIGRTLAEMTRAITLLSEQERTA